MKDEIRDMVTILCRDGRFLKERESCQHGTTSVYEHSVRVAEASVRIADGLHLRIDRKALIRGALLHDYFLYDWHEPDGGHRLHGFRHPFTALRNAGQDFCLNKKEENIILRHMFPLVPIPPTCREAWIVCMADKYCAFLETCRNPAMRNHGTERRYVRLAVGRERR